MKEESGTPHAGQNQVMHFILLRTVLKGKGRVHKIRTTTIYSCLLASKVARSSPSHRPIYLYSEPPFTTGTAFCNIVCTTQFTAPCSVLLATPRLPILHVCNLLSRECERKASALTAQICGAPQAILTSAKRVTTCCSWTRLASRAILSPPSRRRSSQTVGAPVSGDKSNCPPVRQLSRPWLRTHGHSFSPRSP